jgi:hypothetical protein
MQHGYWEDEIMGTDIQGVSISASASTSSSVQLFQQAKLLPKSMEVNLPQDILQIGKGDSLSADKSMQVVYERAMQKLQSVVSDAKSALGISDDEELDTTPEATANRIADFALSGYDQWSKKHTNLSDDESRKQYSDYIGGAIQEGISQARDFLKSLNSLTGDVDSNINSTWETIQKRLNDFVSDSK